MTATIPYYDGITTAWARDGGAVVYGRQGNGVLHATEALHAFRVTCNISTSGGIVSEVVSFHFSVEGHAIYTQQAGCSRFVPRGLLQGFENCLRIRLLCLGGSVALDSGSTHEVRRQMIEGDDVLSAENEGVLQGVLKLPYIARPGILEKTLQYIGGYRFNGLLELDVEPVAKVINQERDVFAPVS